MKVAELLKEGEDILKRASVEAPLVSSELLLMKALDLNNRTSLYIHDLPIEDLQIKKFFEYLELRRKHYPLQYIYGRADFYNIFLLLNEAVFIPRPETEELVDIIVSLYKNKEVCILDIGTGSGCIAISLAYNIEKAKVIGVDISEEAVALARRNATLWGMDKKVIIEKSDLFSKIYKQKFDIIVANPPYISGKEMLLLPEEVLYEPQTALRGGDDGLLFYKKIISQAVAYLKDKGGIFFEIGETQANAVKKILQEYGFENIKIKKDLNKKDRFISAEFIVNIS